jgi:hypothetical protein
VESLEVQCLPRKAVFKRRNEPTANRTVGPPTRGISTCTALRPFGVAESIRGFSVHFFRGDNMGLVAVFAFMLKDRLSGPPCELQSTITNPQAVE